MLRLVSRLVKYMDDTNIYQLYNDTSTYCCEIKKFVVQISPIHYQLYPPSNVKSEAEHYKFVRDRAKVLLADWLFLHGEADELVSDLLPHTPLLTC